MMTVGSERDVRGDAVRAGNDTLSAVTGQQEQSQEQAL
jgi:hypothetical protein